MLFVLWAYADFESLDLAETMGLVPLCAVPLVSSFSVTPAVRLQRAMLFGVLARRQFLSAVCAAVVAVPELLTTPTALAASLQFLLTEALLALSFLLPAGMKRNVIKHESRRAVLPRSRTVMAVNGIAWIRAQLDRIIAGLSASDATLGSTASLWLLGRTAADLAAILVGNVLRPALASVPKLMRCA